MPPAPAATDEARAEEGEALLRHPPNDPGFLFRASLVCKPWRNLLTSSAFARLYRDFHRTPPLLGFFENHDDVGVWFEPSSPTSPFLPMHPDHRELFVLDCRHGLVLMRTPVNHLDHPAESLIVWDPIGRRQWEFPPPVFANTCTTIDDNAVVLCVADGCDHLGCHGGPFLVAYVLTDYSVAYASVFSSETRAWSHVSSFLPPEPNLQLNLYQPKALVGNVLYFNCVVDSIILRFDYIRVELSMIHGPNIGMPDPPTSVLMKTEEGRLGCATRQESGLCLWSMDTGPDGSVAWTQDRVLELDMPMSIFFRSNVIGFVDGIGVFYLRTDSGIFAVDLKSGEVKNINPIRGFSAIPYMSFYTPDQARAITLPSTMASSENDEDRGGWEEVGNGEKEGEQQEEEASQELFRNGSKAFEDGDFFSAVDNLSRSLEIRVARHGKLSPKCRDTYYRYGWALLRKAQARNGLDRHEHSRDLDLAWKMLHVARVILEKGPGSTREKVKILAALAKVSMEREDIDYSFTACFKALAILEYLVEPYYHHIMNLNIQICLTFEFPKSGDAKAISLWKARIKNLKRVNEVMLADKGDDASATKVGLEKSYLAKDIQFVTSILLSALEKKIELEDLEQAISTPVSEASDEQYIGNDVPGAGSSTSSQFSGSSNTMPMTESTERDLEAAGRGIKRANVEQISSEPSPKKFAEDSPCAESDSSNNTDGQSRSTAPDGSVSE